MKGLFVLFVAAPVRIGLLENDLALLDEPLQDFRDIEGLELDVADPERQVLEVDEKGELGLFCCCDHGPSLYQGGLENKVDVACYGLYLIALVLIMAFFV